MYLLKDKNSQTKCYLGDIAKQKDKIKIQLLKANTNKKKACLLAIAIKTKKCTYILTM